MSSPHKALEAFADAEQNPDLARLESLLSKFNLFEAVGVVRQELRHSNLLAFLLDPSQSHGLGAVFLKELLQSVLSQTEIESPVSSSDLDFWGLNAVTVQREWHHIDILVLDNANRFAVIIENKIDTGEHSDQLNRYHKDAHSHYPNYKIIALHLTPDGDAPTSELFHAVSHLQVCLVAERLVALRRSALDSDVVMLLEHYAQMLRRHIVSDSDVAELCRSIYQKHRQALDLIFEHRPDQKSQIKQYVESLLQQHPDISFGFNKGYIVFSLHEWQNSPRHSGAFGENICWLLYFAFNNDTNSLTLDLKVAPGDASEREKHLQMAQKHHFRGCASRLIGKHPRIASVKFLDASDYEKTQDEVEAMITEKWAEYLRDEFPRIVKAVREEEWLWELA